MARWVKALAARSDELSSTPGTHMVGDNSLPFWFFFPTLSIQSDIEAKVSSQGCTETHVTH